MIHVGEYWLIMLATALLCSSCSEELSVSPPEEPEATPQTTGLLFAQGLRSTMSVGDRDTVILSWEHGLLREEDQLATGLRVLRGAGCVRVDSLGRRYGVSAISDGQALLRACIGSHYRDFLLTVESTRPEDPGRDYRSSTRVGIDGMDGGTLTAFEPYVLRASLDGEPVPDRGHVYLDDGKEDINRWDCVIFESGEHLLLSEVEMEQTGVVLYRKFAVQAWQRDDLVLFAGLMDDSSDRLGNAAVYLGHSIPGGTSDIYLSIRLNAGSRTRVLYSGNLSLSRSGYVQLFTYWDVYQFVVEHLNSSFSIDIIVSPLLEYHTVALDCTALVSLAKDLAKRDIPVRINGKVCNDGRYEQLKAQ